MGMVRQTVHEWLYRYANSGGLADRLSRPWCEEAQAAGGLPPVERGRAVELWQMDATGRVHLAGLTLWQVMAKSLAL